MPSCCRGRPSSGSPSFSPCPFPSCCPCRFPLPLLLLALFPALSLALLLCSALPSPLWPPKKGLAKIPRQRIECFWINHNTHFCGIGKWLDPGRFLGPAPREPKFKGPRARAPGPGPEIVPRRSRGILLGGVSAWLRRASPHTASKYHEFRLFASCWMAWTRSTASPAPGPGPEPQAGFWPSTPRGIFTCASEDNPARSSQITIAQTSHLHTKSRRG